MDVLRRRIKNTTSSTNPLKEWFYSPTEENFELLESTSSALDVEAGYGAISAAETTLFDVAENTLFDTNPLTGLLEKVISTVPIDAALATGSATTAGLTLETGAALGGATLLAGGAYYAHKGLTLPGTNYIGPGNKLEGDLPISGSDADALEHDISYTKPDLSQYDVIDSDKHSINRFLDHFVEDPSDIPALIGATGLGIKSAIEKHTGVLYPGGLGKGRHNKINMGENKRKATEQGGPAPKAQDTEITSTSDAANTNVNAGAAIDQAAATTGGTGGGGDGNTAQQSGPIVHVDRPICSDNFQTWKFTKVHRLLSFGVGYKPTLIGTHNFMATPLMEIPWDRAFFYLSPGELLSLPTGTQALGVSVKIVQRNVRVAFETGSTESGTATLNQNKFGMIGYGLNQAFCGNNMKLAITDAMVPTASAIVLAAGAANTYTILEKLLYGTKNSIAGFDAFIPAHQFGLRVAPNVYYCAKAATLAQAANCSDDGWGNMQEHIHEWDMNTTVGTVVVQKSYKFGYCPLKAPLAIHTAEVSLVAANKLYDVASEDVQRGRVTLDRFPPLDGNLTTPTYSHITPTNSVVPVSSVELMEQSARIYHNTMSMDTNKRVQPQIHVGVKPIPKLAVPSVEPITNFVNTQAYWEVTAEIVCGTKNPHIAANAPTFSTRIEALPFANNLASQIQNNLPLYYGRYALGGVP